MIELIDRTLVQDRFGLGVLEEFVSGLRDPANQEDVVAMVAEDCLEESETRGILYDVPRLVDIEHDTLSETLARSFTSEMTPYHRQ